MANKSKSSPYAKTQVVGDYLDLLNLPALQESDNDQYYTIESKFDKRPDLLSNKLYGTTRLWWVFTKRNMNLIEDPINDFRAGLIIRIPEKTTLSNVVS